MFCDGLSLSKTSYETVSSFGTSSIPSNSVASCLYFIFSRRLASSRALIFYCSFSYLRSWWKWLWSNIWSDKLELRLCILRGFVFPNRVFTAPWPEFLYVLPEMTDSPLARDSAGLTRVGLPPSSSGCMLILLMLSLEDVVFFPIESLESSNAFGMLSFWMFLVPS